MPLSQRFNVGFNGTFQSQSGPSVATLDELEDLVDFVLAEPNALNLIPNNLLELYRTGGAGGNVRNRYELLSDILDSLGDIPLTQNAYDQYLNTYGPILRVAQAAEIRNEPFNSSIFTDYSPRTRPSPPDQTDQNFSFTGGGTAFSITNQTFNNFTTSFGVIAPRTADDSLEPGEIPGLPPEFSSADNTTDGIDPRVDPDLRILPSNTADGIDPTIDPEAIAAIPGLREFNFELDNEGSDAALDELRAQERAEFEAALRAEANRRLARINQAEQATLRALGLEGDAARFNQRISNFQGPLSPTRGNFNSGFVQRNRGLRNTGFGFEERGRELQAENAVIGAAQDRADVEANVIEQLRQFDAAQLDVQIGIESNQSQQIIDTVDEIGSQF